MVEEQSTSKALQPFTIPGVARFAYAPFWKLLATLFSFAVLGGLVAIFVAQRCWSPVITDAVANLPTTGRIHSGELYWPEKQGRLLAANEFLSIETMTEHDSGETRSSDIALLLSPHELMVGSLAGFAAIPYPPGLNAELNRDALSPWWGAWKPALLALFGASCSLGLFCYWCLAALIYSFYPIIIGGALNREISFRGSWKLACASQIPGAILISFALILYAAGQIALIFLIVLAAAHWITSWIYLLLAPLFLRKTEATKPNPFTNKPTGKKSRGKNPFGTASADE